MIIKNYQVFLYGGIFDLELNNLPSSIKKIIFNKYTGYNKSLNNLPNSVKILILPLNYNLKISNIPLKLKTMTCSKNYKYMNDFVNLEGLKIEFL